MKPNRAALVFLLIFMLAAAAIIYALLHLQTAPRERLQGEVDASEYSISSKVAGRIEKILLKKGDSVSRGQLAFTLFTPEIEAKLAQAQAGQAAAKALVDEAETGARAGELTTLKDHWQQAKAAAELAEKTYQRILSLYNDGVVALQKKDEAYTKWQAAKYNQSMAYSQYKLARDGARPEKKRAAQQKLLMAKGSVAEVEAYLAENQVISAFDGEVANVLLHAGELAPQGFPVIRVLDMNDAWVVFNVREDRLKQFLKGQKIQVLLPALDAARKFEFVVSYIAPMGDFATWRSTDSRQGYDLRTFEVHARPSAAIANWRVGMSAIVDLD